MKHELNLEVLNTYNPKLLRITDTSVYLDTPEPKCGNIQITSPGFISPVNIEVDKNFNLTLTACQLGIQRTDCGINQSDIPDGIYHIIYSISPNDKLYAEYNYLRVTKIMNEYFHQLSEIEIHGCYLEDCQKKKLKDLREIKSLIEVAKAKVEYKNSPKEGMEILKYAKKRLDIYCKTCCK